MSTPNPNWPTLFAEAAFAVNPYYSTGTVVWTDLTKRLYKQWSIRRGKQFELDQVQPAEFRGQWVNTDGFLDPSNTSSPFSPNIVPYRGYRMRAQYPPSANLLTADQATGGEGTPFAPGSIPAAMNIGTDVGATLTIASSATAFQGSQVLQAAVPASVSVNFYLIKFRFQQVQTPSGQFPVTYTWSTYVRCATSGINPSVAAAIKFFDVNQNFLGEYVGSTVALTGSPTATWTRINVSQAPPANSAYAVMAVAVKGTPPASPWTLQVDGSQWEQNAAASAFSTPGTNYSMMSGAVERYPQSWGYSGTYGLVSPIGVDTMALLSQTLLSTAFVNEVVETSPQWFYQLNETSGVTTFAEQAGRTGSAVLASVGTGSCSPGSSMSAATTAGKFLGADGPVVTFNNSTAGQGTFINLTPGLTTVGPPAGTGWTRMFAFRSNAGSNSTIAACTNADPNILLAFDTSSESLIEFLYQGGSGVTASVSDGINPAMTLNCNVAVNDNNWHLVFFTLASDGKTATLTVDSTTVSTVFTANRFNPPYTTDAIGGGYYAASNTADSSNFIGDFGMYAQWNSVLSAGTISNLYSVWRNAAQGESSGARYSRILRYANYQGAQNVDTGSTTNMGPCNDINGIDALTCLQNIVNTEYGRHFVDASGVITFQSRFRSFSVTTPVWTFGENQAAGEIPYVDLTFDYDPTHISNLVQVTQNTSGLVYTAFDTASEQNYGVRNLTRNSQSADSTEVLQQAYFLVSRYKNPSMRVNALTIDVASNPALFPLVLKFELGQYVAINRRSVSGASTITAYGFIEQITHTGDDQANWKVDLQISPVPVLPYAVFTALKTTLNTAVSSGTNVITINALPDAATNPVRSELTGGQQLMIGSGTTQETVTIATGGVQNQAAGYSTAQLTLMANLVNSHVAGEQVIEYNGVSYDTLGVFDTSLFSY